MSRSTFTPADAAELAVVVRSGFVESRHVGSAVVLDPAGSPLISLGAPAVPVFTRSSLKPLQAIAAMSLGARVTGASAALATASHKCEGRHAEVVSGMLDSAGLCVSDLRCPPAHPADGAFRRQVPDEKSPLFFNCSGKHSAFLMAAVALGADTASYLDPEHPVQRRVAEVVESFAGESPAAVGVDGCGAPVFALSLAGLARAVGRVVRLGTDCPGDGRDSSAVDPVGPPAEANPSVPGSERAVDYTAYAAEARTLIDGVFTHPWGIEGKGRPNTTVIERLGVFAKGGAEGVIVMATKSGYSVAVKCLDGSSRATGLVALTLLDRAGAFDDVTAANDPVVTPELLADVISAITDPVTGGTDSEGRTAIVGEVSLGEDLS
ncbi:asparaginase [Brevibacterium sp.]|uniref:asparaginase n=1 Tax=Brevibacterium sp. TaxID=1701 RepID=UPI00281141E0|nr:asparaginase [Brevibacterium sp.]